MNNLKIYTNSIKFRWFIYLQLVITILVISVYFYYTLLLDFNFKYFKDLFEIWSEFTWTNIGLYMGANTVTKYVTLQSSDFKRLDIKNKKTHISYLIFKTIQIVVSIIVGYYLFKNAYCTSNLSWDEIVETIELYANFTWVNISIFYTGNITSKFNSMKEQEKNSTSNNESKCEKNLISVVPKKIEEDNFNSQELS